MMATLEELKRQWQSGTHPADRYDLKNYKQLIKQKMKKQQNSIFRYFWGTFVYHVMVYAMLTHVLIRYWSDSSVVLAALVGLAVTIPFTAIMVRRFGSMASKRLKTESRESIREFISHQLELLNAYFLFKNRYEWLMIPLQCAVGVFIVFRLFVPGGVQDHPVGAMIVFGLTIISCIAAIRLENRKSFTQPATDLKVLLKEWDQDE